MLKFLPQRVLFITTAVFIALTGCNNVSPSITNATTPVVVQSQTLLSPALQTVVGDYVSDGYDKRQQGNDWVGVMIRPSGSEQIDIKVRSRSDIKKPTCNFDGKATLMGQDNAHGIIFQTIANDSVTFLQFKEDKLTIDAQNKYALNYFCSGGATLAGDYQKIDGSLNIS